MIVTSRKIGEALSCHRDLKYLSDGTKSDIVTPIFRRLRIPTLLLIRLQSHADEKYSDRNYVDYN